MRSQPYKTGLDERLKDPKYASAYLSAAWDESNDSDDSNEVFMLALRDVVEVHKVGKVAAAAKVNRETLYRTLSARGNPTVKTLKSILKVLRIKGDFIPLQEARSSPRKKLKSRRKSTPVFVASGSGKSALAMQAGFGRRLQSNTFANGGGISTPDINPYANAGNGEPTKLALEEQQVVTLDHLVYARKYGGQQDTNTKEYAHSL